MWVWVREPNLQTRDAAHAAELRKEKTQLERVVCDIEANEFEVKSQDERRERLEVQVGLDSVKTRNK